jgi:5,6-dimethylbenzimidazole synthase
MNFTQDNIKTLENIILNRRDVRGNNFKSKKIKIKKLNKILQAGLHAPSVGFSQPWQFVVIKNKNIKNKVYKNFKKEYKKSKQYFKTSKLYSKLKLEGIKETPINIAVYYKKSTKKVLGQTSQEKMGEYSVVCAIQNMWLMARTLNIGIGWVSILNPKKINKILDMDNDFVLVGYLCVGYVKEFYKEPELKKLKWAKQKEFNKIVKYK